MQETLKSNWLQQFSRNVTSQVGEDGVLEKIFEILEIEKGWCVEFGAWDGKLFSNTYNLINNHGWFGILIEGSKRKYTDLLKTYPSNPNVFCLHKFVSFDPPNDLDSILASTPCPTDLDLISIDIDGFDLHVWESIVKYQPKVVVVEFNPTIPNHISFVQARDVKVAQGNSLLALIELGKRKNYELIATTEHNGFFVRKEFFPLFKIEDNSINAMKQRSSTEISFFQLYDGTIVLSGHKALLWGGERIRPKKIQILPKYLRYYSTSNILKKFLRKSWKLLKRL